jgi:PPOX class probable F420-dependent enzyme
MSTTLDPSTPAGARALERLATEQIGWLTTVNPDGVPQSSPIWFLWVDGELLIHSHRRAPRNGNLADRPGVSFNLNTDVTGDEVVTMEGTARIDPAGRPASADPAYVAKYRDKVEAYGWTFAWFDGEYPVVVRVTPTRWRVT